MPVIIGLHFLYNFLSLTVLQLSLHLLNKLSDGLLLLAGQLVTGVDLGHHPGVQGGD